MFTPDEAASIVKERDSCRAESRKLSAAYLRLRELIPGALDTPNAPSAEEVWAVTERALKNLLYRAEIREAALTK